MLVATDLFASLRHAVRRLGRRPLYTGGIVGLLALAMGAAASIFGLSDDLVMNPLRLPREGELISLEQVTAGASSSYRRTPWIEAELIQGLAGEWQVAVRTTPDDLLARKVSLDLGDRGHDDLPVRFVSANYLSVLAVRPVAGRDLSSADDVFGAPAVGLVARRYARMRFGSEGLALEQRVVVNGVPVTIVGVADDSVAIELSRPPVLYLPIHLAPSIGRDSLAAGAPPLTFQTPTGEFVTSPVEPARSFQVISRVTEQHRAGLESQVRTRLRAQNWRAVPLRASTLSVETREAVRQVLWVLGAAVALVLVLASVNAAFLIGGDLRSRAPELVLRAALGASQRQLVQLVGAEIVCVSLVSGALAVLLAVSLRAGLSWIGLPGGLPVPVLPLQPTRLALFTSGLSVLVAGIVAIPALWQASRQVPSNGQRITGSGTRGRSMSWVCAVQAGLCVMVLGAALFFAQAITHALVRNPGFNPNGLIQATVSLGQYERQHGAQRFVGAAANELRTSAGIEAVSIGPVALVNGSDDARIRVHIDGRPLVLDRPLEIIYADADYFRAIGQPLLAGRDFGHQDAEGHAVVVIVNEAAGRAFWPGENPLGHELIVDAYFRTLPGVTVSRVRCRFEETDATPVCNTPIEPIRARVVGVVPAVAMETLGTGHPIVYYSQAQRSGSAAMSVTGTAHLAIRSQRPVTEVAKMVEATGRSHGVRLDSIQSATQARDELMRPEKLAGLLLGFLTLVGLTIVFLGTYASVYTRTQRERRGNAVRLVLGANPGALVRSTLRRMTLVMGVGVVAGNAAVALWGSKLLQPFGLGLPGIGTGPLLAAGLIVTAAGAVAAYLPSRQMYTLDPVALLRE
jgi:predicted permease